MWLSPSLVRELPQSLVVALTRGAVSGRSLPGHSFGEPVSLIPEAPILLAVGDCFTW